jgi:hypothetical protein
MKLAALAALLVLGFSFANPLAAQKGLKLGAYILPHYSLMLNQTDSDLPLDQFKYEHTFGMAAGLTFGANFTEGLGVRFSPMYSVQGQNFSYQSAEGWTVMNYRKLHYIKAPIMVGFNTNTEYHKVAFSMYAGFQLGLLTHARFYNDDESYTPDEALWDNVTDYPTTRQQYNTIDYGPCGEIGMDVMLTYNVMANLRLRGDYSLTDSENKNAAYKITENGVTRAESIYAQDRAATTNITGGIMLGITYTLTAR